MFCKISCLQVIWKQGDGGIVFSFFKRMILCLLVDLHATKYSLYAMVMTGENDCEENSVYDNGAQYVIDDMK